MGVRRWVAGVLCLPLLVLSACSDDDSEPDAEPSESITQPTPTDSTTPTETKTPDEPQKPKYPDAADGSNDKAARAFARYWIAMINYAQATGDVAGLASIHASGCTPCQAVETGVRDVYEAGQSVAGGNYTPRTVKSLAAGQPNVNVVAVDTDRSRQRIRDRTGKVIRTAPAGETAFKLYLRRASGGWVVGALEVLS